MERGIAQSLCVLAVDCRGRFEADLGKWWGCSPSSRKGTTKYGPYCECVWSIACNSEVQVDPDLCPVNGLMWLRSSCAMVYWMISKGQGLFPTQWPFFLSQQQPRRIVLHARTWTTPSCCRCKPPPTSIGRKTRRVCLQHERQRRTVKISFLPLGSLWCDGLRSQHRLLSVMHRRGWCHCWASQPQVGPLKTLSVCTQVGQSALQGA